MPPLYVSLPQRMSVPPPDLINDSVPPPSASVPPKPNEVPLAGFSVSAASPVGLLLMTLPLPEKTFEREDSGRPR